MMFLPLEFTFGNAGSLAVMGFGLVIAVLAVLLIFVKILSIFTSKKKGKKEDTANAPAEVAPVSTPVATEKAAEEAPEEVVEEESSLPYTPGYVTLDGVAEQDAAVIMAITSHKTGIALERLAFKSIKRLNQDPVLENVSEQDAAVIMAITSDKTGIALENLCFNSIKLVEE